MTGPEHYKAAEADLAEMPGKSIPGVTALLARAQVHATLALAAASALGAWSSMDLVDRAEWEDALEAQS
jgi:hypothetical protein